MDTAEEHVIAQRMAEAEKRRLAGAPPPGDASAPVPAIEEPKYRGIDPRKRAILSDAIRTGDDRAIQNRMIQRFLSREGQPPTPVGPPGGTLDDVIPDELVTQAPTSPLMSFFRGRVPAMDAAYASAKRAEEAGETIPKEVFRMLGKGLGRAKKEAAAQPPSLGDKAREIEEILAKEAAAEAEMGPIRQGRMLEQNTELANIKRSNEELRQMLEALEAEPLPSPKFGPTPRAPKAKSETPAQSSGSGIRSSSGTPTFN